MKTLLCFAFLIYSFALNAQTLDNSFADSGILIEKNKGIFNDFALQSNGKIIVAGTRQKTHNNFNDFVITRYNVNGSLDTSFGNKGYAGSAGTEAEVYNLAIQKDDGIIAAGRTTRDIKIERFTKNGELDRSFGNNGAVIFSVGINAYSYVSDVAVQSNGKILICGYAILSNQKKLGFILRYLTNGAADSNFGNNGVVSWQAPGIGSTFAVTSIAQQQNEQILVHWYYQENDVVNRYNINGTQDSSFGDNGAAHFQSGDDLANRFYPYQLIVQPDDKIIGNGYAQSATGKLFFAAGRLNKNGSIDESYGKKGLQHIAFDQQIVSNSVGVLQNDGKLILAGSVKDTKDNYAMTRLTTTGIVDSTFGKNGRVITEFEKNSDCYGILLQNNDKILLGGYTGIGSTNILIACYNNNAFNKQLVTNAKSSKQANELAINVSPNPAKNILHIEGLPSNQKIKTSIVDFAGNIKMQTVTSAGLSQINIAVLKPGYYLLKMEISNQLITKKFMKE